MATNTREKSYFGQTILLMALAIIIFVVVKESKILPDRLFSNDSLENNTNIVVDSMALMAINEMNEVEGVQDTLVVDNNEEPVLTPDSINMDLEEETINDPNIAVDGYKSLKRFYAKLQALEQDSTKKVRVAYFGDSMNDGDFIVQDVRSLLQDKFGGRGVGFVSISSVSASARGSVSHQYSKGWLAQSFVSGKKPIRPFGIDGQMHMVRGKDKSYWVKYRAQGRKHSTTLPAPTLFYGRSDNDSATISVQVGKGETIVKELSPKRLLNTLKVSSTTSGPLQVTFNKADSVPIYGFNFDNGEGVHVDNFSARGNSGLPLSILSTGLMNAFDNTLNYDLIILQYGANVLGYGTLDYRWYEKNMTRVIEHLRACFPHADILVISTADRATKQEEEMKTDPAVLPLAKSQRNYALKNNAAYISLYNLMGGSGSMVTWVDKGLAGKDYTHFTGAGSKKIAKMIYDQLMKGYDKYKEEEPEDIEE